MKNRSFNCCFFIRYLAVLLLILMTSAFILYGCKFSLNFHCVKIKSMIFSGTFFLSTKSVIFLCAYSVLLSGRTVPVFVEDAAGCTVKKRK